jgi:N-acetylneuraminate lyase
VNARKMAESAAAAGADGIICMPPVYFKPMDIDDLVRIMAYVAAGAPETPFWYYHFPDKTGVNFNMF